MITKELEQILLELRVVELKLVLCQLALPASGKKADLQTRIFNYLGHGFLGQPLQFEPVKEEWKRQAASKPLFAPQLHWARQNCKHVC